MALQENKIKEKEMKSENDYNKFLQEVKSYFEKEGLILEEEVTEHEIIHYTLLLYSYHNRYISVGIQDNENNLHVSFTSTKRIMIARTISIIQRMELHLKTFLVSRKNTNSLSR